jgi:signal transduction histidine kinase
MHEGTRSEYAVPIIFGGELLGVFDLESPLRDAFTPEDQQLVHTLADQVATTMRNVSQYEELTRTYEDLRRTRQQMTARTALAWVNMASGVWRHAVVKHALTIKEQAQLLQSDWGQPAGKPEVQQGFAMITRLADQIMQRPIAEPLSSTTGLRLVSANGLVGDRVKQLKQYGTYPTVELRTDLQVDDTCLLRVNPDWIRSALDILIDNAVDAVKPQSTREVVVGTRVGGIGIEAFVQDTGPGLPAEVIDKLGLENIEKPEDAQGLGMGLLMARMIVQTYGGDIRVVATSSSGTTMAICLPLAP